MRPAVVFFLISFLVRLFAVGKSSFWLDEMVSLHFASQPGFHFVFLDNAPAFYHLILKGWIGLFGLSEVGARSFSVLVSAITTAVLYRTAFQRWGITSARVVAVLHIISPFSVYYAQEARMYALFELGTALSILFFFRLLEGKNRIRWFYLASVGLLSFTHYLSIVPLGAQWLFGVGKGRKEVKVFLLFSGLLGAMILVSSFFNFFSYEHLNWQVLKYQMEPGARWPKEVFLALGFRNWVSTVALVGFLGWSIFHCGKNISLDLRYLFFAVFFPLLVCWLGSAFVQRAIFHDRYYIYLNPPLILLVGGFFAQLEEAKRKMATAFLVFLVLLPGAWETIKVYRPTKAPWREMARKVGEAPNSVVLTTRTEAIVTPYFKEKGISVLKWDPLGEGASRVEDLLNAGKTVWILDNYWGGFTYLDPLEKELKSYGFKVENVSIRTEFSEPLVAVSIKK